MVARVVLTDPAVECGFIVAWSLVGIFVQPFVVSILQGVYIPSWEVTADLRDRFF